MSVDANRVLVVDDDASLRLIVSRILRGSGYAVLEATNGRDAIRFLDSMRKSARLPCILILDIELPVVGGLAVMQYLRSLAAKVPVLAISSTHAQLEAAKAAGAEWTMLKPLPLPTMLAAVQSHCTARK